MAQLKLPFTEVRVNNNRLLDGSRVYAHRCPGVTLFLVFIPDPKQDAYTFEFGWSRKGDFPSVWQCRCPYVSHFREEFQREEMLQRIGFFLDGCDRWWHLEAPVIRLPNDVEVNVQSEDPRVRAGAAMELTTRYFEELVIPYFEEYMRYVATSSDPGSV